MVYMAGILTYVHLLLSDPLSPARFLSFRKTHFINIYYLLCKSSGARSNNCCPISGIQKGMDSLGWKHTAVQKITCCTFHQALGEP